MKLFSRVLLCTTIALGAVAGAPGLVGPAYAAGVDLSDPFDVNGKVDETLRKLRSTINQLLNTGFDRLDTSVAVALQRAQETVDHILDHADEIRGKTFKDLSDTEQNAMRDLNTLVTRAEQGIDRVDTMQENITATLMRIVPGADRSPFILRVLTPYVIRDPALGSDVILTLKGNNLGSSGHTMKVGGRLFSGALVTNTNGLVQFRIPRSEFMKKVGDKDLQHVDVEFHLVPDIGNFPSSVINYFLAAPLDTKVMINTVPKSIGTVNVEWSKMISERPPVDYRETYVEARQTGGGGQNVSAYDCIFIRGGEKMLDYYHRQIVNREACHGSASGEFSIKREADRVCLTAVARPLGSCSAVAGAKLFATILKPSVQVSVPGSAQANLSWSDNEIMLDGVPENHKVGVTLESGRTIYITPGKQHPWFKVDYFPRTEQLHIFPKNLESSEWQG